MMWRIGRGWKPAETGSRMSLLQRLWTDKGGNVAIMFALSAVPMIIVVGSAVDYSRAVADRTQLQKGTDAAALAGIKAIRQGTVLTDSGPLMTAMVQTNDLNPTAQIKTATLSTDGSTLCVTSTATVTTSFMQIVNMPTISVGAQACAKLNLDSYEIAFAFDNSGSMADSALNGQTKMQAAQSAANGLISALVTRRRRGGERDGILFGRSLRRRREHWLPVCRCVVHGHGMATGTIAFQHFQRPSGGTNPTSRFQLFSWMSSAWGPAASRRG